MVPPCLRRESMAYIDFFKMDIYVLTGPEAFAYINEYLRRDREDVFGETDIDDALGWAFTTDVCHPLANDQFKEWSIEPFCDRPRYSVHEITNGDLPLYYVEIRRDTVPALEMFNRDWLYVRHYTLRCTYE